MFTRKEKFYQFLEDNQSACSSVLTAEKISSFIHTLGQPCPPSKGAERQRYYRIKKKYIVKEFFSTRYLFELHSPNPLRIVSKEELFDLFERVHTEGGKHLGRDRLFADLKSQYTGFSRSLVLAFVSSCQECQLQKSRKSLKNIITHPIRSPDFASRGQVDLIDFQASNEVNLPYKFLLVYQDHLTKFVVLRPLKRKTAEEVSKTLMEIFCLIGSPHILQSDNGREFKNINLATMIRELWPGCKIIHGKPRHPESQGSVERVNREIKKVLGSLMRKANDPCWVTYVPLAQHSINTSPHSTLENRTPYRVLFGRNPVKGLEDLGIPNEIANDVMTEEEMNM